MKAMLNHSKKPSLVALATVVLLSSYVAFAQVTATLSVDVVSEFQSVTLTVINSDENPSEPDFSVLDADFETTNVSTSTAIQWVNGNLSSQKTWRLVLMPKRTGTIDIPPIIVGNRLTNGLRLKVNPLSNRERAYINDAAFFETTVSHDEQYPQAAIYVTRRLLYSDQTRITSLPQEKQLDITDASVLPIGARESLREVRGNTEYSVAQWRYVIFAEKSGELKIPGESVRVGIYGSQFRSQVHSIVADDKIIRILAIPAEYPRDAAWFPAAKLTLTDTWEPQGISNLALGDALSRTIEIRAQNSYQSALLPLELSEIPGLRVYPEQASVESVLEGNEVWGTQARVFNLIPFELGRVEIPEFRLTWWDTEAKQVRVATLSPRSLAVADPSRSIETTQILVEPESSPATLSNSQNSVSYQTPPRLFGVYVAVLLSWLGVLIVFLIRQKVQEEKVRKSPRAQLDYNPIRSAVQAGDAVALRQAVLQTIAHYFAVDLVVARNLLQDSEAGQELLEKLDRVTYAPTSEQFNFDFKSIRQVIDSIVEYPGKNNEKFGLHKVLN